MWNNLQLNNSNISSARSVVAPVIGEWKISEDEDGNSVGEVSIRTNDLMAHSIFHPLRRIMLAYSSSYGIVATRISINNGNRFALHEYDVLEGVLEDVSYIILNIKKVLIKTINSNENEKQDFFFMTLESSNNEVKAGEFVSSQSNAEVVNKDFVICHLDFESSIKIEILVVKGYGYVSEEDNRYKYSSSLNEGFLFVGTIFSSVLSVSGKIKENSGGENKYDILDLQIVTDGREHPKEMFEAAVVFYLKQLEGLVYKEEDINNGTGNSNNSFINSSIDILNLETRSVNALKKSGIMTVGMLVGHTPAQLLVGNSAFGKKSLQDVRDKLLKYDLCLKDDEEYLTQKV